MVNYFNQFESRLGNCAKLNLLIFCLCETSGGGCGDFEVVSKMQKVRKCLKQKNSLNENTKNSSKCHDHRICTGTN